MLLTALTYIGYAAEVAAILAAIAFAGVGVVVLIASQIDWSK